MNLRLVQFNLGRGARHTAEDIATRVVPVIRAQPGCEGCEFFGDDESGDYGIVVFWASKPNADAAAGVVSPILSAALAEARATDERRRLFDMFQLGQSPAAKSTMTLTI
jgi:heme-degrading monooxygenase HmoA